MYGTYAAAANEDDDECLQPSGGTDHPDHANEEYHTEDVLNARKIDAEHRTELLTAQPTKQHSP